ncbi:LLM class flavin-dependent oxidoreductase [Roseateles aquatilis]|uniref:LLM class flavin-dependent oxidoreductase n=2 Tax=Roseateles aquatilis TaxID=431061 RepID=A0A246JEB9_9BURK|nr:LLM class flavin-dependent oxidoreductase [Roseateles aquatilis]
MLFAGALAPTAGQQYEIALQLAEFADREGLAGIWFPERHFTSFGGPYPNPMLILAAVASRTRRLTLRSGSLVAPLHDPIRLAEELAMLDQLSGGRIETAFASGWHPNDYAFHPERYEQRRELMFESIDALCRLWRGDAHAARSGLGEPIQLRTHPRPVQSRLQVWIAAAQNPETFRRAGERGEHVLTHVLDGNLKLLADNIALYRRQRAAAGHDPEAGRVALMLHTFLGDDEAQVAATVRGPYGDYLKSIVPMAQGLATARARAVDLKKLNARQITQFVDCHYDRAVRGLSLIGTPAAARATLDAMRGLGVDEVACLVDFGVAGRHVLAQLPHIAALQASLRVHDQRLLEPSP